jgi:hypothetical protein
MKFSHTGRDLRFRLPFSVLIALSLAVFLLPAEEIHAQDLKNGNVSGAEERDLSVENLLLQFGSLENALPSLNLDSNGDGREDYLVRNDLDSGDKMMEILDFNHDGEMDDFYFYEDGILRERAIDSNFDGLVDLWVYIEGGVYIAYYEKDTDFDGKMDKIKRYSQTNQDG